MRKYQSKTKVRTKMMVSNPRPPISASLKTMNMIPICSSQVIVVVQTLQQRDYSIKISIVMKIIRTPSKIIQVCPMNLMKMGSLLISIKMVTKTMMKIMNMGKKEIMMVARILMRTMNIMMMKITMMIIHLIVIGNL